MNLMFQKRMSRFFILGILISIVLLASPALAGLNIINAKYSGTASPGDIIPFKMTVSTSASDPPMDVSVDVMGFGQAPDKSYSPLAPESDTSPYSARTYITLDASTLSLNPGEPKDVTATITIPKDTGPGGRYALIYFHTAPSGSGATGIVTAILVPIMITISGSGTIQTGTITSVQVGNIVAGQPITVTTSLENTGNFHYYDTVNTVQVTDASGNVIATQSTAPSPFAIIPGNTVNYVVNLNQAIPPGTYNVTSSMSLSDGTVLDTKTAQFVAQTAYAGQAQEVSVLVSPGSPATLASSDGTVTVNFPAGSVLSTANVTLSPFDVQQLPPPPSGAITGTTCFRIDGLNGLLSKDATITVKYSSSDLNAAGGDATKLVLARYDQNDNAWTLLPTQVNAPATTLSATTNQFSIWAVMASNGVVPSNVQSTPTQKSFLDPLLVLAALGVLVFIGRGLGRND
jgi:hypothetical protein